MNRAQFEHTVRAAGAVLGVTDILVIGSQALHATASEELPHEAERSMRGSRSTAMRGATEGS